MASKLCGELKYVYPVKILEPKWPRLSVIVFKIKIAPMIFPPKISRDHS